MLRNRVANEDLDAEGRANVELRLKLVMEHARYRGWIVQKKQVARANLSLDALLANRGQLQSLLDESRDALAPGERARLRRIAAGELATPGRESET
jgi:hypothetical protein